MFNPLTSLGNDYSQSLGMVKLWYSPNIAETKWSGNGVFGQDCYSYFFIPPRFVHIGGDNFEFITPFDYTNEQVTVNGYIVYKGQHWLQEGKTVPFWHLKPTENKTVTIQTDLYTKLPFLETVTQNQPNFTKERCYFIPVNSEY